MKKRKANIKRKKKKKEGLIYDQHQARRCSCVFDMPFKIKVFSLKPKAVGLMI